MKKVIKLTESQLKQCIENVLSEQSSRLAAIKNNAPALNNKSSEVQKTYNQSVKLTAGTYKNSVVKLLSDNTLELNIPGKGVYSYSCGRGCTPTIKKVG
jgi:aspartyl/asparaginyl-tRNA synthetase